MTVRASIRRDAAGVPHIQAATRPDLAWGLGYCHAMDRGLQMLLMRILGQGRAAEMLDGSDETVAIDTFFRRMNWREGNEAEMARFSPDVKAIADAYCEGVNARLAERSPWEL